MSQFPEPVGAPVLPVPVIHAPFGEFTVDMKYIFGSFSAADPARMAVSAGPDRPDE
jgi:hypothetical protein